MKNFAKILALVLCLVFAGTLMIACDNGDDTSVPADTTAQSESVLINDDPIGEDAACEVAYADAGIPSTAAENLSVKMENVDGVDVYIVYFEWSGFSYTYTIDAVSGTIIDCIFD